MYNTWTGGVCAYILCATFHVMLWFDTNITEYYDTLGILADEMTQQNRYPKKNSIFFLHQSELDHVL